MSYTEKDREYRRKYYQDNKEHCRAVKKRWNDSHRKEINSYVRSWRKAHPERYLESMRLWRIKNPEAVAMYHRRWALKNREHLRDYYRNYSRNNPQIYAKSVFKYQTISKIREIILMNIQAEEIGKYHSGISKERLERFVKSNRDKVMSLMENYLVNS